jgi:hypothetical protein
MMVPYAFFTLAFGGSLVPKLNLYGFPVPTFGVALVTDEGVLGSLILFVRNISMTSWRRTRRTSFTQSFRAGITRTAVRTAMCFRTLRPLPSC